MKNLSDFHLPPQMPYLSPLLCSIAFVSFMIAITSTHWISTDNIPNGIFLAESASDNYIAFKCAALMSSRQCQLLNATKAASVITIVWCFSAMMMLFYKLYSVIYNKNDNINHRLYQHVDAELKYPLNLILKALIWLQLIFGVTTITLYGVFASSYYMGADDDINYENGKDSDDNDFDYAFYLWIVALVFSTSTLGVVIASGNKPLYFCISKDDDESALQNHA